MQKRGSWARGSAEDACSWNTLVGHKLNSSSTDICLVMRQCSLRTDDKAAHLDLQRISHGYVNYSHRNTLMSASFLNRLRAEVCASRNKRVVAEGGWRRYAGQKKNYINQHIALPLLSYLGHWMVPPSGTTPFDNSLKKMGPQWKDVLQGGGRILLLRSPLAERV